MMIALIFLTILLIIDLLYAVVDPRVKGAYKYANARKKRKPHDGVPAVTRG